MYTYEDNENAKKKIDIWENSKKSAQESLDKLNLVTPLLKSAIEKGEDTYIGPKSGKTYQITDEMRKNVSNGFYDKSIKTFETKIKQSDEMIAYWKNVQKEYEAGNARKEEIKTSSPEVTPVVNVNVAPVIPTITSPCAVSGGLADALAKAGKIAGTINSVKMIKDLAKKDPLAAAAAAAGLLGLDTFKKAADFNKQMENKVNAIRGNVIPLGPVTEIANAINKASSMVQSATDCLNTAISSTVDTINAGSASVTNRVQQSVSALDSSIDSMNSIMGKSGSRSYKAMKTQIKNPVTQLPKDIQSVANKMNGINNVTQMSAGLANNMLNDLSKLTSAVQNVSSGNPLGVLAGVGTLRNAKTMVNSATGSVKNIKGAIQSVTK